MNSPKQAKDEVEVRKIYREDTFNKIEDILGFIATKTSGAALLGSGVLEFVTPDFVSAVLPQPLAIAGVGFMMVAGKRGARLLIKALDQFLK